MSAVIVELKSRTILSHEKAQAVAAAAPKDSEKWRAVLKEIEGFYISADIVAALPAQDGYVTLRYPAGTPLEDLPYTNPKIGFFRSEAGFGSVFRRLAGKPSICLGDHFEQSPVAPDDSSVQAGLYGFRVAGFYEVTEAGLYVNALQNIEIYVPTGQGIVEFENGDYVIDTVENCRRQIRPVYRR